MRSPANHSATLLVGLGGLTIAVFLLVGCEAGGSSTDPFGRTYYIDGAGNWGYGVAEIHQGLRRAGYRGSIINYTWSPTFNPALDQTVGRPVAHLRGADLGKEITAYLAKYPDHEVNIICLSAGTGVGVWACENIQPPAKLHNLVMLGSSLSSDYDMRQALANVAGRVYVYHSTGDMVLQGPVRTLGTIDGKLGADAAGLVGLRPRGLKTDKIVNIPWSSRYERYGWTGAHTDATSEPFVIAELSKHIVSPAAPPADAPAKTAISEPARPRAGG
ncbi:MAG: hypothetical protein HY718_15535 [Planctomycetes bacterium]|nr:hypothetical protein [Planctomycetota bacterium]